MTGDEAARRRRADAEPEPGPDAAAADAPGPTDERKRRLADSATAAGTGRHDSATLIDDELETLFSTFQRSRASAGGADAARSQDELRRARRLRAEEIKVRALNRNGRVDYSIQE